jgi:CheY-like chemotaxis protein
MPALILAVDDDQQILKLEKSFFERFGCTVMTAFNGADALRLASLHPIDVVVLDFEMPAMDGAEVAARMREIRPQALIIMLSGGNIPAHARTLVDGFIAKENFSRSRLLPVIASLGAAAQ